MSDRHGQMRGSKVVIAFGGNAICPAGTDGSFSSQLDNVRGMASAAVDLIQTGFGVVLTHGNGPQVGRIALQQEYGEEHGIPGLPYDAAGAMSQGLIGYMLQQSIENLSRRRGLSIGCATIVTQVIVDSDDAAFANPTKPVGLFYSQAEAERLKDEKAWTLVEDAGRGYRRVVPSPYPKSIVEWPAIRQLLEAGILVIAAGGGGIPVVEARPEGGSELRGVEAVIDKDRAAACLGALVGADTLVLLTDVERVAVGYGTPSQRWLGRVTRDELQSHVQAGEFPPGSMGPKVESAIRFLDSGGERAIITSAGALVKAMTQDGGTQILPNEGAARHPGLVQAAHG